MNQRNISLLRFLYKNRKDLKLKMLINVSDFCMCDLVLNGCVIVPDIEYNNHMSVYHHLTSKMLIYIKNDNAFLIYGTILKYILKDLKPEEK